MKRIVLFISIIIQSILQMAAQESIGYGTITLSHQGKEKEYAYNEMIKVMDDAADGDTIYLSAGTFQGDFIMTKKLTLIGSGAHETTYNGDIYIRFSEGAKLTSRLFDAIKFDKCIYFESNIDSVRIRKCQIYNCIRISSDIDYLLIDRCEGNFWGLTKMPNKLIARNSFFNGTPNAYWIDQKYYNCNFDNLVGYTPTSSEKTYVGLYGTFVNCIISTYNSYFVENSSGLPNKSTFINCLYYKSDVPVDEGCIIQNCYTSSSNVTNLTKEELEKNKYLGTDGTVVGYYGGKNPFTLLPFNSEVHNSLHLDREHKQIQFNINISEQK